MRPSNLDRRASGEESGDLGPMLKDLDFVYQSLSAVIINRQALARTRFIQPPL
jgi:hypothetical protein